jgi:hypothetical protein
MVLFQPPTPIEVIEVSVDDDDDEVIEIFDDDDDDDNDPPGKTFTASD